VLRESYKNYGWSLSPMSTEATIVRITVLYLACLYDVDDCRKIALKKFDDFFFKNIRCSWLVNFLAKANNHEYFWVAGTMIFIFHKIFLAWYQMISKFRVTWPWKSNPASFSTQFLTCTTRARFQVKNPTIWTV